MAWSTGCNRRIGGGGRGGQDGKEDATGEATGAYLSAHSFWKWGITALFDIQIVNLDAGSYLCQTSAKALAMGGKDKK